VSLFIGIEATKEKGQCKLLAAIIESSKGQGSSQKNKKKNCAEKRKEFMTFSTSKVDNCFGPR
jgi:hypothetical protein